MILLIEDEEFTAGLIAALLAPAPVRHARNGLEGLQLFRSEPFDMIITDLVMPVKDGLSTITDVRKFAPSIPILAISIGGNLGGLRNLQIAKKLGATATLAKPFERVQLMEKIEECLAATEGHPC